MGSTRPCGRGLWLVRLAGRQKRGATGWTTSAVGSPWSPRHRSATPSSRPTATPGVTSGTTGRYLASRWHDEFDAWAAEYVNPYADLIAPIAYRSWDSDRRLAETESDGIAAEVLFPNTVPPVLRRGQPGRPAPDARGLRASLGRRPGAQPLAGRLLRRARPAGGPASSRSSPTTWTTPSPRCAGPPPPSTPSAASCCRPSRPTPTCLRCGRTTTSRCGGCARSSTCPSTSTAAARCPTTGSTRRRGP